MSDQGWHQFFHYIGSAGVLVGYLLLTGSRALGSGGGICVTEYGLVRLC